MLGAWGNIHLFDAFDRIGSMADEENLKKFVEDMNAIISGLGGLDQPETGIQFDGVMIAQKLYDAIQIGLMDPSMPAFDATSVVDAIVDALGLGRDAIALIVHQMVQDGLKLSGSTEGAGEFKLDESGIEFLQTLTSGNGVDFNLDGLTQQLYGSDGASGLLGELAKIGDNIPSVESLFDEKGWLNFTDSNGEEIDIISMVQGKIQEVNDSLPDMESVELTITPVFNMENMSRDKLQAALDAKLAGSPLTADMFFNNPTVSIDFKQLATEIGMEEVIYKLTTLVNAIAISDANNTAAINSLGNDMDAIAEAVANMRLYLDGDLLVGGITSRVDNALGDRSRIYDRTGVTYNLKK